MNTDALLEIKDLKISFPLDEGVVQAVQGVSLTIRRGEVLGVVGESGCGKTVTAQSILRIIPPPGRIDAGQILFRPPGAPGPNGAVDLAQLAPTGPQIRAIRGLIAAAMQVLNCGSMWSIDSRMPASGCARSASPKQPQTASSPTATISASSPGDASGPASWRMDSVMDAAFVFLQSATN